jgi:hypothetical protein
MLAGALVVGAVPALAAQRYATPTGTGSTCTQASPCSLTTAVGSALAGDEVIVGPGSYGSAGTPLSATIQSGVADLDVHGVDAGSGSPGATIFSDATYGVVLFGSGDTVSDLDVEDSGSSGGAALALGDGGNVSGERLTARAGASERIACELLLGSTLSDSLCQGSDPGGDGLDVSGGNDGPNNVTLRNVTAVDPATGGNGIEVDSDSLAGRSSALTAINTIARGGGFDIEVAENTQPASVMTSHSNYNAAHDNVTGGATITDDGTSQTTGDQTMAQLFVNPTGGDFREGLGAQTIGAGLFDPANGSVDFLGDRRVFDSGGSCASTDIGADQFQPAATPTLSGPAAIVGGETTATVSGSADPLGGPGSYHFDYAPAGPGGAPPMSFASTPEQCVTLANAAEPAMAALSGLTPGMTYYYRLVASNGAGTTTPAFVATFLTTASPTHIPTPQSTTALFGNQRITLTTPSLLVCSANGKTLSVSLSSTAIPKSKATKLRFSSAAFYLDRGVKHTKHRRVRTRNGKTKTVTVITYTANATVHHVPVAVALRLARLKPGTHTLTVKLSYKETKTRHRHKRTVTVTKTLKAKFVVC